MSIFDKWWKKIKRWLVKKIPGIDREKRDSKNPDFAEDDELNLSKVVWLHRSPMFWSVTRSLKVNVTGDKIILDYGDASQWPGKEKKRSGSNEIIMVNANPWVFVPHEGKVYAATFEWLRVGQNSKGKKTVNGDHIKKSPLRNWSPVSGQKYYFMVSGLARDHQANIRERSNVVGYIWP